ncbi:MAG: hypothetical protein HY927_12725 [Elusimicrobia bacterium]|nr:hypothetical protein [Elusimicrobiota bacterium]
MSLAWAPDGSVWVVRSWKRQGADKWTVEVWTGSQAPLSLVSSKEMENRLFPWLSHRSDSVELGEAAALVLFLQAMPQGRFQDFTVEELFRGLRAKGLAAGIDTASLLIGTKKLRLPKGMSPMYGTYDSGYTSCSYWSDFPYRVREF